MFKLIDEILYQFRICFKSEETYLSVLFYGIIIVYLAAQRLTDFCKQLSNMLEEEKAICFKRVEEKDSARLSGLYKDLGKYYK